MHRAKRPCQFVGQGARIIHVVMVIGVAGKKLVRALARQHGFDLHARQTGGEKRRDGASHKINICRLEVLDDMRQRLGEVVRGEDVFAMVRPDMIGNGARG